MGPVLGAMICDTCRITVVPVVKGCRRLCYRGQEHADQALLREPVRADALLVGPALETSPVGFFAAPNTGQTFRALFVSGKLGGQCSSDSWFVLRKYIPTIGIDYGVKPVRVMGHDLKVNFFDTSGGEVNSFFALFFFLGGGGFSNSMFFFFFYFFFAWKVFFSHLFLLGIFL